MKIRRLIHVCVLAAVTAAVAPAQYKVAPGGAAPAEASALAAALTKEGVKVLKEDGTDLCQMWLAPAMPTGGKQDDNVSLPDVPHGALIGVVQFAARHSDRRGQTIKPGVYTMRYSRFPMNGDHMGVSPQRDFLLLSLASADTDAAAKPDFEALMTMSRKASGTPHPLILSFWKDDAGAETGIEQFGESEQILHTTIGGVKIAIMVAGRFEG